MIRHILPAACALAAAALFAPSTALAWKHIDPSPYLWHPDDLPVEYCMPLEYECEETIGDDTYCWTMMKQAHQAWEIGAPCASLGGGVISECEAMPCPSANQEPNEDGDCTNMGFTLSDPRNTVGFNDPNRELEAGVLGANLTHRGAQAFQLFGTMYRWVGNSDIVFNDNVGFASHEDVTEGRCQGRTNIRAVAVHEVGHLYGMGHSCDQYESCTDPDLRGAVMFWTSPSCETLVDIQKDDIEGINALYGPSATFQCNNQPDASQLTGVVDFALDCHVDADDEFLAEIVEARWTWGDGEITEGIQVNHVYDTPGNYTIELRVTGQRDTCQSEENTEGLWESSFRRVGFVTACDIPDVAFTYEHVDGLTYGMINQTDVSVYGCINDIEWQVYEGDGVGGKMITELTKKAWEPRITFPDEGTYTVVVNVGGPAGTGAAMIVVNAKDRAGQGRGCSHTGVAGLGGAGALFLSLGLVGLRRRRD